MGEENEELCGLCERELTDTFYINIELKEYLPEKYRLLCLTTLCSEQCMDKLISHGSTFIKYLKHFSRDDDFKPSPKPDDYKTGNMRNSCSYCGRIRDQYEDYNLQLWIDGQSKLGSTLWLINDFCSKECYRKALDLKEKYMGFAVDAYSPDRCIVVQLHKTITDEQEKERE